MKPLFILLSLLFAVAFQVNAQWVQTSLAVTQNILSLAEDGPDVYAGTFGSGVFVTSDDGVTWTAINNGLGNMNVRRLAVVGGDLFAGTLGQGVSMYDGVSWTARNSGLTDLTVRSFAFNVTSFYAGTNGKVFLSTDTANTWSNITGNLNVGFIYAIEVIGSDILVATNSGVYRSSNGGVSWSLSSVGLTTPAVYSLAVQGSDVFAGTNGGGVFRSTDNGNTWTPVNNGLSTLAMRQMAVDGPALFASTANGGVFQTNNFGMNWTTVNTGLTDLSIFSLLAGSTHLYAGTSMSGVFKNMGLVTEVNEEQNKWPISIYPNPSNGRIFISDPHASLGTIQIYDAMGALVYEGVAKGAQHSLDISSQAKGMYQVHLIRNELPVQFERLVIY